MITTFFGPHAIGGDSSYVDRLSRALLRHGHEVEVVHCADAFAAVGGGRPARAYNPPAGLRVHAIRSPTGRLSPLWTHQTGGVGPKARAIDRILEHGRFDVVHFHNVSLVGGPGLIARSARTGAVRLMTLHDHWLVCPLSLLWKLDREPCEKPDCVRCMLHARRPPQLWRATARLRTAVEGLDALICPSASAAEVHRRRGVMAPMFELPHLLPEDWATPAAADPSPPRPYVVAAGRLVREKGFEDLIRLMARLPEIDLRIAGEGPLMRGLRELAAPLPNVELVGPLAPDRLAGLFEGALALVAPSLFYETFGYVVLEAASVGTPAIVRRRGALPEVVERLEAGFAFDTDDELEGAVRTLMSDPQLRRDLGERARAGARGLGSEQLHLERYLELVEACGSAARHPSRAGADDRSLRLSPA